MVLDAIWEKLQWLERDLGVTAARLDTRLSAVRHFIRYLLDEVRSSERPDLAFHERCQELGAVGDLVLAVNALDLCEGFIRFEPSNQMVIVDQFCLAARMSERFKAYCDIGAVQKAAFQELLAENKRDHAVRAAQARHARDPKQKDKAFVYECWKRWRAGDISFISKKSKEGRNKIAEIRSKAAFADEILSVFRETGEDGHITSHKKIQDWCREWEKS